MENEKEWPWLKKETWGEGEWQNEPDRLEWIDQYSGYHCIAKRVMSHGGWCGYVGIPKSHPYTGKDYDDIDNIEVHGGLTYADSCNGDPGYGICHKVEEGEDDVWWFGFDCAHAWDISPARDASYRARGFENWEINHPDITYKNLEFVKNEITNLARQLKEKEGR